MATVFKTINCPQCGAALENIVKYTKLIHCQYCDSLIVYEDENYKSAGKIAALSDEPSLLQLHKTFTYENITFTPIGQIRYTHDFGYWEEWFALDSKGEGFWVSVDEGDFAFESSLETLKRLPKLDTLQLSKKLTLNKQKWIVTELSYGICEGFNGQLPSDITIGERFDYVHLSSPNSNLLMTLEYYEDKTNVFEGIWVDPYEIKVAP